VRIIRMLSLELIVLVSALCCVSVCAQGINDSTIEQLRQLKKICDDGLVSQEICKEKQRDILGLRGSSESVSDSRHQLQSQLTHPVAQPRTSTADRLEDRSQPSQHITVTLPSGWTRSGSEGLQSAPKPLLRRPGENPETQAPLEPVAALTDSAEVVHFNNDGDNLLISIVSHSFALDPEKAEKTCNSLAARASNGQSTELLDCGLRQIGGFSTMYVEKDGPRGESRVIQIWVAKSPEEVFQFFLHCKMENLEKRKKELEGLVASVQLR
jgi:hypothetical protein